MQRLLTEKTFFQYLKCPSWIYHKAEGKETDPVHPLKERLLDDGLLPELQKHLLRGRPDVAEVTAEDTEEAFYQTLKFMKEGRGTIYGGMLLHGHWVGNPDVLEKVEGHSVFGRYYYVAADIKRSRVIRSDYKFQGCFYAELLAKIQKTKPVLGYIITPDEQALGYPIEEFESQYKLTLHEIERILAGEKPSHFLTSGCKQSPWFGVCQKESIDCDDLSVLNRVWRQEVACLKEQGIKTIDMLSKQSVGALSHRCPSLPVERLERMREQALAMVKKTHFIKQKMSLPKAETELFFDIESDPLRDVDYLFGVLEAKKKKQTYHAFLARTKDEEPEMWQKFMTLIEKYPDAPIYHYGTFEREVIERFQKRYGISETAKKALGKNMIDLNERVRPAVIFPLAFYSLKDIAQYLGFFWRDEEANGANSVLWFEEYVRSKTGKKKLLDRILHYNEDDVLATYHLKQWLAEHAT